MRNICLQSGFCEWVCLLRSPISQGKFVGAARFFKLRVGEKSKVTGGRQTTDSSWKFLKIEDEKIKTAQNNSNLLDRKFHETPIKCVKLMNSKRQVKWNRSRGTNSRYPFDVNVICLNSLKT